MAGAHETGGAVRYFSGDGEDPQEYKRWKTWASNKLLTLDKLPKTAKGAWIYTLLTGKALECIEHLAPEDYQKEGGELVIWDLLDQRFPLRDQTDELGELLTEVFTLKASEGETLKGWIGRASELFDRLNRKTGVNFPDEARGWILLHKSELTSEQKAVVLARAMGNLKRERISTALRSCYPDMVIPKRRAAHLVEDDQLLHLGGDEESVDVDIPELEMFLAEHSSTVGSGEADVFTEADVAEVLAVSWKEKRAELNKLQKSRRFSQAREVKRSFKVEIEELKRRTKCNRCGKIGHWARECRQKRDNTSDRKPSSAAASSTPSGAAVVQVAEEHEVLSNDHIQHESNVLEEPEIHFIASVEIWSLIDRVRNGINSPAVSQHEALLVSSPGYGVLDSGCGKTIIGTETLQSFQKLWKAAGIKDPTPESENNLFRFGNGQEEVSTVSVELPVFLAGKFGVIKAAVVSGQAPLLISRAALQSLEATMNFKDGTLTVFPERRSIPMKTNAAGQFIIDVMKPPQQAEIVQEVLQVEQPEIEDLSVPPIDEPSLPDTAEMTSSWSTWTREDWGCKKTPCDTLGGPPWKFVRFRKVFNSHNRKLLFADAIDPNKNRKTYAHSLPKGVDGIITEFSFDSAHYVPGPAVDDVPSPCIDEEPVIDPDGLGKFNKHQVRQIQSQVKGCALLEEKSSNPSQLVVEVFSPPRFVPEIEAHGYKGRSIDIKLGTDLTKPSERAKLREELRVNPPELLIVCPPCTDEGGWFHLNSTYMDKLEYLRRRARSRSFIKFAMELYQQQVNLGGRALFEHPTGSRAWSYPEVQKLCRKYHLVKCHMCQYGLQLPDSKNFIRKSTRLLVSHEDMKVLGKQCPGPSDPNHQVHDSIAGSHPKVGQVSSFAGQYTKDFVWSVLNTLPSFRQHEVLLIEDDSVPEDLWHEVCAVSHTSREELLPIIQKLHKNLGHPSNSDLVRVLKHGQASEEALQIARELDCAFCKSHAKPKTPFPSQVNRVLEFNRQIGLDVKHLKGWKPNQKVKALNIVDHASGFQRMIPFFETDTSKLLRDLLEQHWIAWAGIPEELILDPAQTNLGEPMLGPAEAQGTIVRPIAAEAHWQLGKVENHGGWFERILSKIIDEHNPKDKDEWLECVTHAHVKNTMIQMYGFTPHQFVFGRNPMVPSDLLSEPVHVIPATASLTSEAAARSQAIRASARRAVLELQDDKALRVALAARPRVSQSFKPGDLVAYWRNQKWQQGVLHQEGRWYGTAIVIGYVGRNLVLAHRKNILRCAPEQVRFATSEERTLIHTPQVELLGIKDMIEGGAFKSQQYIDLVHQSYPNEPPERPSVAPSSSEVNPKSQVVPGSETIPSEVPPPFNTVDPSDHPKEGETPGPNLSDEARTAVPMDSEEPQVSTHESQSSYGPVRRRIVGKDGKLSLYRPAPMQPEDFVDIMREVVPRLIDSMPSGTKRSLEVDASDHSAEAASASEPPAVRPRTDEVLSVESLDNVSNWNTDELSLEILIADYLAKKMSKELHHSNNPPDLQAKVDKGKRAEWNTLISKDNVLKIHYGKAAQKIRDTLSHRFIGSRFVITRKPIDEGVEIDQNDLSTFDVKGRWCLQGHLDPDLDVKAMEGKLKSPTLSQLGRMLIMQILASQNWSLQLGDIKGAFLEADPLEDRFRPLFAHQPPGGIPGIPSDAVIEILGNLYGQNDAPSAWFRTFDTEIQKLGWKPSCFDPCLYTLRDDSAGLCGILGVHVDDCAVGGAGLKFEQSIDLLKKRFPFRKWRVKSGEFCGAFYKQDHDGTIHMSMQAFADKLRPANLNRGSNPDAPLEPHQVKVLRAINGGLNWLSTQSRPDLAAQTSLSQQAFPTPRVRHLKQASNVVRRAKQHADLDITFKPIPLSELSLVCHSDAAFANVGTHTQAGFIIAFTQRSLNDGKLCVWNPVTWKSYKLPRAVSSTLGAESQAMSTATGTVEWLSLLLAETLDGSFDVRSYHQVLSKRPPIVVTDCKSLYDHLVSPSSPTSVEDRRTSIDIVIIRDSLKSMAAQIRWVPTDRMLADSLTKDAGDPIDLLRSCIRSSQYQISPEETVLQNQAAERERRLHNRQSLQQGVVVE